MIDLKDFQEYRNLLETWYERILNSAGLLQADEAALRDAKQNLHAERFVVAVCGQMNSGKSTLLNALLFADEVLPSAATTMTAKITLIEGNDTESVEATMYTPDEFRCVVAESKADEHASEELLNARDSARAAGIREAQLVTDPAQVERRAGLNDLLRFAAVSDKGGKYNVYVKSIRVLADRPWVHQVTVADTPGTNDPNPVRDRITREWIARADAVVYVTFAGQAGMDNEDVKFIDEHLAHVSPKRRIIAVNKCDDVDVQDKKAIWSHIRKIQSSDDLRMRNLFGNDDRIVLVSGLGALIASMQDAGRTLSEDMMWHARKMAAKGYLDAERHGVERLRLLIERHIIDNKAEGIVQTHQRRIASVFEKATRRIEEASGDLSYELDATNASREERANEKRRLSRDIDAIAEHTELTRHGVSNELVELHSALDDCLHEVRDTVMGRVEESLSGTADVGLLAKQAHWAIQDAIDKQRSRIVKQVQELASGIENRLNDAEQELSEKFVRSGFDSRVTRTHLLPLSARTICKDAETQLVASLDQELLAKVVRSATNWWQRAFNTAKGRRSGIEELRLVLGEALKDALERIPGHTERELKELADEAVATMEASCRGALERRQSQLEALQHKDVSNEDTRERINRELADMAEQKQQVKELADEYKSAVAS